MNLQQLERDIEPFIRINDNSAATGALSPTDAKQMQAMGSTIVRKHVDFFSTFFATSLSEINRTLTLEDIKGSYQYSFRDIHDATNCFDMVVSQVVDGKRAIAVGALVLLVFLQKGNRNSSMSSDEAEAAIHTIAHLAYSYRRDLIQEFIQVGQELRRKDSRKRWLRSLALLTIGIVIVWLIFK